MEYVFICLYGSLGSTIEFESLMSLICFKLFKKIVVALFDEKAPKLEFYAKTNVFITIYLKDCFTNMCDTKLTSCTVSLLLVVAGCSIEEFNV